MPVQQCQSKGRRGWKWGRSGKCFVGRSGRARAARQGRAIRAAGFTENQIVQGLENFATHLENNGNFLLENQKRIGQSVPSNPLKSDPSRTKTLRRVFEAEFLRRFNRLRAKIFNLIVTQDAFGLKQTQNEGEREDGNDVGITSEVGGDRRENRQSEDSNRGTEGRARGIEFESGRENRQDNGVDGMGKEGSRGGDKARGNNQRTLRGNRLLVNLGRWAARSSPDQLRLFQAWLQKNIQADIITTTAAKADEAYWKAFVQQGYEKGAGRAFDDTRASVKAALKAGDAEQLSFFEGTRTEFLRQSFGRPVAIDKVKILASRVFTDLKGVTEPMAASMNRFLADGLAQGLNPRVIARNMIGPGSPLEAIGKRRATLIARTEVIRAHAEGQLDAFESLEVVEVGVMAEWSTAGDDRVCPLCQPMEGTVMTVKEARSVIPRHVQCRCAWIPANVGESKTDKRKVTFTDPKTGEVKTQFIGPKRGKPKVDAAIDKSIRAEIPKKTPRTLKQQKQITQTPLADKTIAKARPKEFTDVSTGEKLPVTKIQPRKVGPTKVTPTRVKPDSLSIRLTSSGIRRVSSSAKTGAERTSKHIASEVESLRRRFPVLETLPEVELELKSGTRFIETLPSGPNQKVYGSYSNVSKTRQGGTDRIKFAAELADPATAEVGAFNVGEDVATGFRHEYGHHAQNHLKLPRKVSWKRIAERRLGVDKPRVVSSYGMEDQRELYAESFAVYTDLKYVRGTLPKDIEEFFDVVFRQQK